MRTMYQGRQMRKKAVNQGMFSFMENQTLIRRANKKDRYLEVRGTRARPSQKPHWLDAMLGVGSKAKLKGGARRVLEMNKRVTAPAQPRQVERPVSGVPGARRGWIRMGLAAGLILWSLTVIRPVDRVQDMMRAWQAWQAEQPMVREAAKPRPAEGPGEAQAAPVERPEPKKLTPVIPGLQSGPVALWKSDDGVWHQMDALGNLSVSDAPQNAQNLGLPVLQGMQPRKVADGDRLVLRMENDHDVLQRLFPLHADLAPEVEMVDLRNTENPVLITYDGVNAPLGEGEYKTKQARLALVLHDLAAKKRRASSVDMRYSNSAVVKLRR